MTHAELVARAVKWLKNTRRCRVVLAELQNILTHEIPDAIGWQTGRSFLVECKTTKADFKRDAKKTFRKHPGYGMGDYRYYMTRPGLLKPDELPDGWGLLEARPKQVRIIRESAGFDKKGAALRERTLLCKALALAQAQIEQVDSF